MLCLLCVTSNMNSYERYQNRFCGNRRLKTFILIALVFLQTDMYPIRNMCYALISMYAFYQLDMHSNSITEFVYFKLISLIMNYINKLRRMFAFDSINIQRGRAKGLGGINALKSFNRCVYNKKLTNNCFSHKCKNRFLYMTFGVSRSEKFFHSLKSVYQNQWRNQDFQNNGQTTLVSKTMMGKIGKIFIDGPKRFWSNEVKRGYFKLSSIDNLFDR